MKNAPISLAHATQAHIPAIVDLWRRQDLRQYELDASLHKPRLPKQIREFVQNQIQQGQEAFVALGAEQRVQAYVAPAVWDLSATSVLHAFLTPRNGITEALVLPDPESAGTGEVVRSLLQFLSTWWYEKKTTGELLRWPSSERWLEPFLKEQEFLLDSYCAVRSITPFEPSHQHSADVVIRHAQPGDEERLLELFLSEMEIHAETVVSARISDVALQGFRSKLQKLWRQEKEEQIFILVAEHATEGVVGMAENVLIAVGEDEAPGFTAPGFYGCLDNVSVKTEVQGQGIGRQLVNAAFRTFLEKQPGLNEAILWYNPDNPTAGRFWPRLGFHDIWTTYQRLHPITPDR